MSLRIQFGLTLKYDVLIHLLPRSAAPRWNETKTELLASKKIRMMRDVIICVTFLALDCRLGYIDPSNSVQRKLVRDWSIKRCREFRGNRYDPPSYVWIFTNCHHGELAI